MTIPTTTHTCPDTATFEIFDIDGDEYDDDDDNNEDEKASIPLILNTLGLVIRQFRVYLLVI